MEKLSENEIDAWLCDGGRVVTASDRAARAIRSEYDRTRIAEGLGAWPAPEVLDWKSFVRAEWEERSLDGRLLLNPVQEEALWERIAGNGRHMATLLEDSRHRLARMAMEAHGRLCGFAPQFLRASARSGWPQDAGVFSEWLSAFDTICQQEALMSPARLPLELVPLLNEDSRQRPPIVLAGFDRILPTQRAVFEAWGTARQTDLGTSAGLTTFYGTADAKSELAACAIWCNRKLADNPRARLLVITQDAHTRRGEIERAFLRFSGCNTVRFEFSLGIPLGQVALARGAHLLLRWLTGSILEHELDWLLSTGQTAANHEEATALQSYMRTLRRRGQERTQWTLPEFIAQRTGSNSLPGLWVERTMAAHGRLAETARHQHSPFDWSAEVPSLLQTAGWPGYRPLSSAEYQALSRWQLAVETAGSLGFDGRRLTWREFLSALHRTVDETLFAAESNNAPIQIAGPTESAGLTADAVWFLGADENAWPASGPMHPLLPKEIQRSAGMPHGSSQLDWELAHTITARLLASAPEVRFSFARQNEGADRRPSRLIIQAAGNPTPLPQELIAPLPPPPATVPVEDRSRIPFPPGPAPGGSGVLTAQSQCPFKAFAGARLGAKGWNPAEPCLTPSQRGQLLHDVLHSIWSGPPEGIRSQAELLDLADRSAFVAGHVRRVLTVQLPPGVRQRMPVRYLELEELRLTRLVTEWLDYEATRAPFAVAATEAANTVSLAGLELQLRLDRVDRLIDRTLLVIDYKSGEVSPKSWELPRPDDVQLPLYAGFALNREEDELGGLVFAKIRPGKHCFAGRVGDARATLLSNLTGTSALVRNPLTGEQILDWREYIEQLAREFVGGHAEVDPREYPETCRRCELQTVCRIQENRVATVSDDEESAALAEVIDE